MHFQGQTSIPGMLDNSRLSSSTFLKKLSLYTKITWVCQENLSHTPHKGSHRFLTQLTALLSFENDILVKIFPYQYTGVIPETTFQLTVELLNRANLSLDRFIFFHLIFIRE